MPYIKRERRDDLDKSHIPVSHSQGELNYLLTRTVEKYRLDHGTSYGTISDIVSALECAKLEFYRRVAVPYEDLKLAQNGDVYLDVPDA